VSNDVPRHVLATNDFPPKVGGIQSYLWELWRRLPPDQVQVLTTADPGAAAFDRAQPFSIHRSRASVLLPTPKVIRKIREVASAHHADLVVLDPALPLGLVGRKLDHRYAVVLHGAEVTVPGRLPGSRALLRWVLGGAALVIAAGRYPLAEAERAVGRSLPAVVVPPGVDVDRFRPLDGERRRQARARFGLPEDAPLVLTISRLVPRKGVDTAIEAVSRLVGRHPGLCLAVAGSGRDRARLERRAARSRADVRFLGRVRDEDLPDLYGCADIFVMLCRDRWGGLEQEGFGIVFLEAAAAGVPAVAGASGGAAEAVEDGSTGTIVDPSDDPDVAARALASMLDDDPKRQVMGQAARARVVEQFSYARLVGVLAEGLARA
jgi:phosphatidylinositol alpha-1,6-mannosyltransferase